MKLGGEGPAGQEPSGWGWSRGPGCKALTRRELEVLALLAASASSEEIAARLGIKVTTVKGHLSRVYRKLGTTDRTEAVRRYLLEGPGEQPGTEER